MSYKIIAKLVPKRIVGLLKEVVTKTQTKFIKERYILENMITSQDELNWKKESGKEVYIVLLYF